MTTSKDYSPIKVRMIPGTESFGEPNGISRVIENYYKYGKEVGIRFVEDNNFDLLVTHAGATGKDCDVSILHGVYFTGDYKPTKSELYINSRIVDSVRSAKAITVPSRWVAEIIQRDMHINPFVVPHGIDYQDWEHENGDDGYVLYNKNRDGHDVCNSDHLDRLAVMAPDIPFVTTFSKLRHNNIEVIGVIPHDEMKQFVQKASVYLSVTKETFGIGILEAMASGVPVLGWRYGGNVDIIDHGSTGYLAEPGNYDDLLNGLRYIFKYRKVLSSNAKLRSQDFSWSKSLEKLREVFDYTLEKKREKASVAVVVPTYNKSKDLKRCIQSIQNQSYQVSEIVVVDDGSKDDTERLAATIPGIKYIKKDNGGVASARNAGYKETDSKYVCFLDADDQIDKDFIRVCVEALEKDPSLYLAYTKLKWIKPNGDTGISNWPDKWSFSSQLERKNQVPTCNVMRRELLDRTGGFRSRYCPRGAGTEDADLWTRSGALGMKAALVSESPMFIYSFTTGLTAQEGYREEDWLGWNGYLKTGLHPFASYAAPREKSHRVFQYDQPAVSIIIPVGPGHEDKVFDAIDSVEGQTYKKWEIILVNDSGNKIDTTPFPFVRYFETPKPKSGPGVARNLGAKNMRGKFIVFLDADDWIDPKFLETTLSKWNLNKSIIYTNYFGISTIANENIDSFGDKVADYDPKIQRAKLIHKSDVYDCAKAQKQPEDPLYHWCIVTCLIPKEYHDEIGGFDESMKSWEDVDYHWRMARSGKCYTRVEENLVTYRFDTGNRREMANPYNNIEIARDLLRYMKKKYEKETIMPCVSCGQNSVQSVQRQIAGVSAGTGNSVMDDSYILIVYNHPNRGDHSVIGPATGINYGYRAGGDSFLVHKRDNELMPDLFIVNKSVPDINLDTPSNKVQDTPEPAAIIAPKIKKFSVDLVPGITPAMAKKLADSGIDTKEKFMALTEKDLMAIDGVSKARAKIVLELIAEMNNEDDTV